MIFSEDSTEQGKRCEITVKGVVVDCIVVCVFEITNKQKVITRKYRLESKDKTVYDNILPSEITFKK